MTKDLSLEESVAEQIAIQLLRLTPDACTPERTHTDALRTYTDTTNEAIAMARRALQAKSDPSWWHIVGKPRWNSRMDSLRESLEKK